jgi:hypothetical protein
VIESVNPFTWRGDIRGKRMLRTGLELLDELMVECLVEFEEELVLVTHAISP